LAQGCPRHTVFSSFPACSTFMPLKRSTPRVRESCHRHPWSFVNKLEGFFFFYHSLLLSFPLLHFAPTFLPSGVAPQIPSSTLLGFFEFPSVMEVQTLFCFAGFTPGWIVSPFFFTSLIQLQTDGPAPFPPEITAQMQGLLRYFFLPWSKIDPNHLTTWGVSCWVSFWCCWAFLFPFQIVLFFPPLWGAVGSPLWAAFLILSVKGFSPATHLLNGFFFVFLADLPFQC